MPVPDFFCYDASENDMTPKQLSFYKELEKKLKKGEYLDVDGNISYLFVYLYKILQKWNQKGFDEVSNYLLYLTEVYSNEEKFVKYCLKWSYDCLLGLEKYEEYLEKTEPKQMFNESIQPYNNRLNVQKYIGLKANPVDILLMLSGRKTKFIVENQGLYKENILKIFKQYAKENGNWFSLLERFNIYSNGKDKYRGMYEEEEDTLFLGASIKEPPQLKFKTIPFWLVDRGENDLREVIKKLSIEAENISREILGIPKLGENWISETMLFKKLEKEFSFTKVVQHGNPSWLGRQHFDIWFPFWGIAVEYHGKQHFEPIDFFGGKKAFKENIERDKRKMKLAKQHNVHLLVVTEEDNQEALIQEIYKIKSQRKNLFFK